MILTDADKAHARELGFTQEEAVNAAVMERAAYFATYVRSQRPALDTDEASAEEGG